MRKNVKQEDENGNHPDTESLRHADGETFAKDSNLSRVELEEENKRLKEKLLSIITKRSRLQEVKANALRAQEAVQQRINECRFEQDEALLDFQSAMANRAHKERQLNNMQRWMTLNDCFFIGTQGPFGTINGLRLGAEAVVENFDNMRLLRTPSGDLENMTSNANHENSTPSSLSSQNINQRRSGVGDSSRGSVESAAPVPVFLSVKVPWSEVNSALGQLALLLSIIETTPNCGIRYRHEILCMGSTSKMGIRRNGSNSVAYYNLYSDDSFQFFGRRNFNTALQCLLQCVLDASEHISDKDPTISLPHPIEKPPGTTASASARGELTVGGLTVAYGTDGVEWTRAMKYLLTNVKHLLLFRPLGLWGSMALQVNKASIPITS